MNAGELQKVIESIKTLNLNVNSETGKEAVEVIAERAVFYLIAKEILVFIGGLCLGIVVLLIVFMVVNILKKVIAADNFTRSLRTIEDDGVKAKVIKATFGEMESLKSKKK